MSASAWVLTVILTMADGSGTAVLMDGNTGAMPEFPNSADCNTALVEIAEQVGIGTNTKIDWEKSTIRCEPKS